MRKKEINNYKDFLLESHSYTDLFKQIDQFLLTTFPRNIWISDDIIKVYIRKSKRIINGEMLDFFDIASIEISEESRGGGIFTSFMTEFISRYPDFNVYVESILNPAIEHVLKKFDFKYKDKTEFDINMYRLK